MNVLKKQLLITAMLLASTANAEQPSIRGTADLKMASSCSAANVDQPPCPASAELGMATREQLYKKLVLISPASASDVCPSAQAAFDLLLPFAEKIAGKDLKITLIADDGKVTEGEGFAGEFERDENGPGHIRITPAYCTYSVDMQRVMMAHELGHAISPPYPENSNFFQFGDEVLGKPWTVRPQELAATTRALEIFELSGLGTDKFIDVFTNGWKDNKQFSWHVQTAFGQMHHKD